MLVRLCFNTGFQVPCFFRGSGLSSQGRLVKQNQTHTQASKQPHSTQPARDTRQRTQTRTVKKKKKKKKRRATLLRCQHSDSALWYLLYCTVLYCLLLLNFELHERAGGFATIFGPQREIHRPRTRHGNASGEAAQRPRPPATYSTWTILNAPGTERASRESLKQRAARPQGTQ